ncbi:MAG: amino acid permease [Bacteroidota bacterium]|nr:amino acid permease [Bacteroidota bacterium]
MSKEAVKENLKKEIGVRSLVLAIINITVGTGIFVIPAIVAANLGAAAILAYLVCGLVIFLVALCFAELGSNTHISGGTYTYIEKAFGPFAGFLANNIYWLGSCVFSDAAIANALADTLGYFFPVFTNGLFRAVFFVVIFGGLAYLNIRSVKNGIRLVELTAVGKIIPLIVLVGVAAFYISPDNLKWISTPTITHLVSSSLLLFFAFMGLETPLSNGGEIKNPSRTVPIGIFLAVLLILLLYMGIQLVTQGVLGETIAAYQDAPLAAVAGKVFGKTGSILIIVVTAISMFGTLGTEVLSIPRILYSGARDGLLPKPLSKIHPKYLTPTTAIIVYVCIDLVFAITGEFKTLATISSASALIVYFGAVLAAIKLRKKPSPEKNETFRLRGGVIIPVLAAIVIIWLLTGLSREELQGLAVFALALSMLYAAKKFLQKRKS